MAFYPTHTRFIETADNQTVALSIRRRNSGDFKLRVVRPDGKQKKIVLDDKTYRSLKKALDMHPDFEEFSVLRHAMQNYPGAPLI